MPTNIYTKESGCYYESPAFNEIQIFIMVILISVKFQNEELVWSTKSNEIKELTKHPSSLQSGVRGPILCKFESLFMYLFETITLNHSMTRIDLYLTSGSFVRTQGKRLSTT